MALIRGKIPCSIKEIQLDITLSCGQSFRWKKLSVQKWIGVMHKALWILYQDDTHVFYEVHGNDQAINEPDLKSSHKSSSSFERILKDYIQYEINLKSLYEKWSSSDANFKNKAAAFTGVRILRQEPVENLFSFICSSNNNISRITGMVERMCNNYGEKISTFEETDYYSFPTVRVLAGKTVESELRNLGFGYRAKYISQTARYITDHHSEQWLYSLRDVPYNIAKNELMKLCGVGAKVADCVCLMSLDKSDAIPVDTHVWQIAQRDYKIAKMQKAKSLNNALYSEIGNHFRDLWGPYAGWAHSVLFSADLKKFSKATAEKKKRINEGPVSVLLSGSSPKKKKQP